MGKPYKVTYLVSISALENVEVATSRWDYEWWRTTRKINTGSKLSAQDGGTGKQNSGPKSGTGSSPSPDTDILCRGGSFNVLYVSVLHAQDGNDGSSSVPGINAHEMLWHEAAGLWKIFEPPSVAQLLKTQQSSSVLTDLWEGEKYCLQLKTGSKRSW